MTNFQEPKQIRHLIKEITGVSAFCIDTEAQQFHQRISSFDLPVWPSSALCLSP